MGCGCGLVGFLVADRLAPASVSLVMVDSHARAVEAAKENSEKFGIAAEVVLADDGSPARMDGTFDVFVGNPPYYSDYRIADVFLETAKRALKAGGACYTVCKNAAGLEPVQRRYFPDVEIIKRRGYAVLKSVKN
jgi:16S rRNA (guanine1207-N2)-methyltransferase